jgi:hypothetical protein
VGRVPEPDQGSRERHRPGFREAGWAPAPASCRERAREPPLPVQATAARVTSRPSPLLGGAGRSRTRWSCHRRPVPPPDGFRHRRSVGPATVPTTRRGSTDRSAPVGSGALRPEQTSPARRSASTATSPTPSARPGRQQRPPCRWRAGPAVDADRTHPGRDPRPNRSLPQPLRCCRSAARSAPATRAVSASTDRERHRAGRSPRVVRAFRATRRDGSDGLRTLGRARRPGDSCRAGRALRRQFAGEAADRQLGDGKVGPPSPRCGGSRGCSARSHPCPRQGARTTQHRGAHGHGAPVTQPVSAPVTPGDRTLEDVLDARGHPCLLPRLAGPQPEFHVPPVGGGPLGPRPPAPPPDRSAGGVRLGVLGDVDQRAGDALLPLPEVDLVPHERGGLAGAVQLAPELCGRAPRPAAGADPALGRAQSTHRIRRRASTQQVAQSRSSQRAHWVRAASNGWWTHALTAIPRTLGALIHSGRSELYRRLTLRG